MKKFTKLLLVSTLVIACMCMFTACNRSDSNGNNGGNNNVESGDMANGVGGSTTPTNSPAPTMTPVPTDNTDTMNNVGDSATTMAPEQNGNGGVVDDVLNGAEDVVNGVVDGVEDTVNGVADGVDDIVQPGDSQRNR